MRLVITETINGVANIVEKASILYIADFDTGASAVPISTYTAKGSLVLGTGSAAIDELVVGADGTILTADPAEPTGVKWIPTISLLNSEADGWINPNKTWVYGDAHSFTLDGGAETVYSVGDKWKATLNGSTLYGYIWEIADTYTCRTVGNALTDHPITLNYYSHADNMVGFPYWFDMATPVFTTTGTAFTNQPTVNHCRFSISGRVLYIKLKATCHATSGGTGEFILTFSDLEFPHFTHGGSGSAFNHSTKKEGYVSASALELNVLRCGLSGGNTLATNSEVFTLDILIEI